MNEGRVYLVGAGPGDPGLLTLRGREALARADVVVYDRLVPPRMLAHARDGAELVYAGKRPGSMTLTQEEINRLLVERARRGQTVVRLKGGDPFVFGRGAEEALALAEGGVPFEVVPGVTAATGASAFAGIPLTHRRLSSAVALVTGHRAAAGQGGELNWQALGAWRGTLTFYMGVANLGSICARLVENGMDAETPAGVIHRGTTSRQRVVTCTVGSAEERASQAGVEPPALLVIGDVVALRDRLAWFEKRPLFGRRIAVTRPREVAGSMVERLEELGAEAIEAPAIQVERPEAGPLDEAVASLNSYDWLAFTGVNGVDAFFDALGRAGLDARALAGKLICAIGPATAARLRGFGIAADLQPQTFTSAGLAEALGERGDVAGARFLCPRSDRGSTDLADGLRGLGAELTEVEAYRLVPDNANGGTVSELLDRHEVDWITFASAFTVETFLEAVRPAAVRAAGVRLASIGPVTSRALRAAGLEPDVEADPHTIPALIDAIVEAESG